MEPHELAIAALSQVAQSTSYRDINLTDKVASRRRSSPNATGNHIKASMKNNTIVDSAAGVQEPFGSRRNEKNMSQVGRGQEYQNNGGTGLESNSSNNSQSTNIETHDVVSTPPTSDDFSSQSTNQDGHSSQLSQLSQVAAVHQPLSNLSLPNITIVPTAGHKRTADGQVKPTAFGSPTSPRAHGHSRNTSAVSNISMSSSRIGELSSELRTRLSYAMVKVNHGWQSNSIDEVESLASQKGSPTSSTSTLHGRRSFLTSPRATIASIQGQTSNVSTVSQTPSGDFELYSRTEPASRTYESFWADHSATASLPTHKQPSQTSLPSKSLAPSADIRPTPSTRRSSTPKFIKPPAVPGHGSGSSYHNTSAPRTPNRTEFRDSQVMQTPTQKTIQEQDAIETLLFMSSPGNSGNMGHAFPPPRTLGSPQQSPLRAEFSVQRRLQGRRVGFDETAASASTGSSDADAEYRSKIGGKFSKGKRGQPDAIDRMLDEMADSSSDEDDLTLNIASPRRVTVGRV